MATTIFISDRSNYSNRTKKILNLSIGVLFLLNGALQLSRDTWGFASYLIGVPTVLMGIFYLVYSFIFLSPKSKFAPKVTIDSKTILLKKRVFGGDKILAWKDVKSITFKAYELEFTLDKGLYAFSYEVGSDSSIQIKETLRKFSEEKNIEVFGG